MREKYQSKKNIGRERTKKDPIECVVCSDVSCLRNRWMGSAYVCVRCFRTIFFEFAAPIIKNSTRAKSTKALIEKLEQLSTTISNSDEERDVYHPSQIATTRRTRKSASPSVGTWTCPCCTRSNSGSEKNEPCKSCDFTLTLSSAECTKCNTNCILSPETPCLDKTPHSLWFCEQCWKIQTRDADSCPLCGAPKRWICCHCLEKANTSRDTAGNRKCPFCKKVCTPQEVPQGEIISRIICETKRRLNNLNDISTADYLSAIGVSEDEIIQEQNRQKEIDENLKRLSERLKMLNAKKRSRNADGNCLFSSISGQLFGKASLAQTVRFLIVKYMAESKDEYIPLFASEKDFHSYLTKMAKDGTWGDELCLNAAARVFRVDIHVISSTAGNWYHVFRCANLGITQIRGERLENPECTVALFLTYHFPLHYEDIVLDGVETINFSSIYPRLEEMDKKVLEEFLSKKKEDSPKK